MLSTRGESFLRGVHAWERLIRRCYWHTIGLNRDTQTKPSLGTENKGWEKSKIITQARSTRQGEHSLLGIYPAATIPFLVICFYISFFPSSFSQFNATREVINNVETAFVQATMGCVCRT